MKKQQIFRNILLLICCLFIFSQMVSMFSKSSSVFEKILICICCLMLTLSFILSIITDISNKITARNAYNAYERSFVYLLIIHQARYKLYFSENKDDIEIFTNEIQNHGKNIIRIGEAFIATNQFNKRQIKAINVIISETKKLMTTTHY